MMTTPRPPFFPARSFHRASLAACALLALGSLPGVLAAPAAANDDPLPASVVDFRPMDLAQMSVGGPTPLPDGPAPVTAPGGDTGGTRGLPNTPRDATGSSATVPNVAAAPYNPNQGGPSNLRLNFQNTPITDVLNYLSSAAGFIVVQDQPVSGTVNLVSQQPVNAEEAVDALNSVLADKGFASIRNGRVLKIVAREGAAQRNLPVVVGKDPLTIPRKDNLVTQIIPVRYLEVGKLVDTLRPLLSTNATVSSNDASNALLLTDTQANIRHIAEIVSALDTSISAISRIKVYKLQYADAKELADVITQLFAPSTSASNRNGQQQGGFPGFPFFGGGGNRQGQGGGRGGQGGGNANNSPDSAAREAAARVIAVSDETTNSVVVSAPDEYIAAIDDVVDKLDTSTTEITETQIFKLVHADANEIAASLTSLYADSTTANGAGRGNNQQQQFNRFGPQQPQVNTSSDRSQQQARVAVVADSRTNSVLVNASRATMAQVALLVGRLDASDSKKQHIYVHTLSHADPSNVAYILNGMFSVSSSTSGSTTVQPTDSRLFNRSTQGASSTITNSLGGTNSNTSRNSSGR